MTKLKSEYHRRFRLRLKEALRPGWACLIVSAFLLYVPEYRKIASVPVLAPVLAVLLTGPPLGTVLHESVGILTVVVPTLASTVAILQLVRPPISIYVTIACTGVSVFLIAYLSSGAHLLGRKIALAQTSVVFMTAHFNADVNVVSFPLKMMATDALGVVAAIVATIFPIPRLAIWEVRQSAKSAVRGTSEFLKAVVNAISAQDASKFGSMRLHSNVLAKACDRVVAHHKTKQRDIQWELEACGARHGIEKLTKGLEILNLHLKGMEMALELGHVLSAPAILRHLLQETLLQAVKRSKSLLHASIQGLLPGTLFNSKDRHRLTVHKLIGDEKEVLDLFDLNYLAAREKAYYTGGTVSARSEDEELNHAGATASGPCEEEFGVRNNFLGRVSILFFYFNFRLYLVEAINLGYASAGFVMAEEMQQVGKFGTSVLGLDATKEQNAGSQGNLEESSTQSRQITAAGSVSSASSRQSSDSRRRDSSCRRSSRQGKLNDDSRFSSSLADVERVCSSVEGTAEAAKGRLSLGQMQPVSPRERCSHRNAFAVKEDKNTVRGIRGDAWKILRKLGIEPSSARFKKSFKIALAITLAVILGDLALPGTDTSFWGPVTVAFIIGNLQGGSWRICNLRLQGTVLGSIFGFLALSASQNHKWAIQLLLVVWVVFSSFIRYSPSYGYLGIVSAFTAAILMLDGKHENIKEFAMTRITETFVGIFCFIFVETLVFPERAVTLARQELVFSLIKLRDCVGAIVTVYTERDLCVQCRSLAVKEIRELEQALRGSFAKQSELVEEAALEPDFWFVPFPTEVYSKLITIQGRMMDILFFMVCSLHATTEDCLSMIEEMERLIAPLRTSLKALQDEVLATVDDLQGSLQAKVLQKRRLLDRIKGWLTHLTHLFRSSNASEESDVERGQDHIPDLQHPLVVLGQRRRSVDGIPVNLKSTLRMFEHSYENVLEEFIAATVAEDKKELVSNKVIMSIGSLTFSLHALLRETVHLERAVHELLQAESPWLVFDFWDAYNGETMTERQ